MKPSKVKEALSDISKVYLIGLTSVNRIYIGDMKNVKVDIENEVLEYDDKGLHYIIDMIDIDMIILNPDGIKINALSIA